MRAGPRVRRPARGFEPPPLRQHGVLFTSVGPLQPEALASVEAWCRTFVHDHAGALLRATLDVPTTPLPEHLTVKVLLWLWPRDAGLAVDLHSSTTTTVPATWLAFDAIETPPEALRD